MLSTQADTHYLSIKAQKKQAWFAGSKDVSPSLIATGVWGLVTGVAMVKTGLSPVLAIIMSLCVFAGSAQLTALPLIVIAAPLWLVFVASAIVNLRFVIFSAGIFPFFRHIAWPKRIFLGYMNGDLPFVYFMRKYGDDPVKGSLQQTWYYLGMTGTNWIVWQVTSIVGIFLATLVPSDWSLEFAAILALLAVLVPMLVKKPVVFAVLVASVVAWATQLLPLRLGILLAVIAGVTAGMLSEKKLEPTVKPKDISHE